MKSSFDRTTIFLQTGKIEGYSYLILLFIAMPLKYFWDKPDAVRVVGMIHGILFIAFMLALAAMFAKRKLTLKNSFISFLLSLVPFGTFYLRRLL